MDMLAAEQADRPFGSTGEMLAARTETSVEAKLADPGKVFQHEAPAPLIIEPWPEDERRQAAADADARENFSRVDALTAMKNEGGFDPPPLDLGPPVVTPPLIRPEIPEPDWRTEELELQELERQERARRERHEKLLRLIDEEGT